MKQPSSPDPGKPYKITERLELFATEVVQAMQKLQSGPKLVVELSAHAAEAASSAASNAAEADDGSSHRDFIAKERICLRELKETRTRLRILRGSNIVGAECDPLIAENHELVKIVAAIIRKAGG
jgi:four helix bundle protein